MKKVKIWVPKGSKSGSYILSGDKSLDEIMDAFEETEPAECVCDLQDLMCKGCQCGAFEREQEEKLKEAPDPW